MKIILTGLRGTGKSSIGQALADLMEMGFIDIDDEIEHEIGDISDFVPKKGWDAFRKIEKKAALKVAERDNVVISTGGGTMMDPESAEALKKNGVVVFMHCDLPVLMKRLENDHRPSLTGVKRSNEEVEGIWLQRKPVYERIADIRIDVTDESDDVDFDARQKAERIFELLQEHGVALSH